MYANKLDNLDEMEKFPEKHSYGLDCVTHNLHADGITLSTSECDSWQLGGCFCGRSCTNSLQPPSLSSAYKLSFVCGTCALLFRWA